MLTLENPTKYRLGIHPTRPANWSTPRSAVQVLRLKALRPSPVEDPRRLALARSKANLLSLLDVTAPQPSMTPATPSPRMQAVKNAAARIFQAQSEATPVSAMTGAPRNERLQAFQKAIGATFEIQSKTQVQSQMAQPTGRRQSILERVKQATFRAQGYSFPRSFMSRPENQ